MPGRKRNSSNEITPKAQKMRKLRKNESPEQQALRKKNDRERKKLKRAEQTEEKKNKDRLKNRLRNKQSRAQENPEQSSARRQANKTRMDKKRKELKLKKDILYKACFNYNSFKDHPQPSVGKMDKECKHCQSKKYGNEPDSICCRNGKIKLPVISDPPDPLKNYISGESEISEHFLNNIRKYNECFQLTSFVAKTKELRRTFQVKGKIVHKIGSIYPAPNKNPKCLQTYFIGDENKEVEQRCKNVTGIRSDIILNLQRMLHDENHLLKLLKTAMDTMSTDVNEISIPADCNQLDENEAHFPSIDEVNCINTKDVRNKGTLVISKCNRDLKTVPKNHRSYDALQYPLIFWQGQDGYHFGWKKANNKAGKSKKISAREFYAYQLMIRSSNHILKFRTLFYQFIVDMYVKIENERLSFFGPKKTQKRCDSYISLRDGVAQDKTFRDIGKVVTLPSTFTGGPRYWFKVAQDAMAHVNSYGNADIYITFKCNPDWPEIKEELFKGQRSNDRQDLIARVFKQKLSKLIELIEKKEIFGEIQCWNYFVKWQKSGLPEAHILVWLKNKLCPSQIDDVISAELPNPHEDPKLFKIVTEQMVHGPCGKYNDRAPCMKNGKCSEKYPKDFMQCTETLDTNLITYRRRRQEDGGFVTKRKLNNHRKFYVDNRWIIPYSPILCKWFNSHINVELCDSDKKYIFHVLANSGTNSKICLNENSMPKNEIAQYLMERSISSNEAVWRILQFPIHENCVPVFYLDVHLENMQQVHFTADNFKQLAADPGNTTLTAFFLLCQNDSLAKTLLYPDVLKHFTWKNKQYQKRKGGASNIIGLVRSVDPSLSECYHLRLLLQNVPGPTSFSDLKIVDTKKCETFKEACQQRGLISVQEKWENTLQDAKAQNCTSEQFRNLFAIIVSTCKPSNPNSLWDNIKETCSLDLSGEKTEIYNQVLLLIEKTCMSINGKTLKDLDIEPPVTYVSCARDYERLMANYDDTELEKTINKNEPKVLKVNDQQLVYTAIQETLKSNTGGLFFIDAPGGTGKTFLLNLLLAKIRYQKKIALAVASTGIASSLLTGGRTAHSAFKLPLDISSSENPKCNISNNSGMADVLKECQLIVWDECTMAHKKSIEALDRILKEIKGNDLLMGGVVVVLTGDFRQTLPVIPGSKGTHQINACIKASYLWNDCRKMTLTTNMRVNKSPHFSKQLLDIGEGNIPPDPQTRMISFPAEFCHLVNSVEELVDKVYPDISKNYDSDDWLRERAILAPTNECVNDLNNQIQKKLPGTITTYKSFDTCITVEDSCLYPEEFLNTLELSGFPSHILSLKIGSPIMLLHNLDPPRLCNGTKLRIKALLPNIIQATILTGNAVGKDAFIPRIPCVPTDSYIQFTRLQFPVKLAFAMTIHKAQGQTLAVAGVNLYKPCFSHGQLYVACSRVGDPESLFIYSPGDVTKNVVLKKALK